MKRTSDQDRGALRILAAGAVLAVIVATVPPAFAQDVEKASQLNSQAIEAYKAQRYIEAIDFWLQACDHASAEQLPKLYKNIGLALHKLERQPEAWYYLSEFQRRGKEADEKVTAAMKELEDNLARTYMKATIATDPTEATVILPPGDRLHKVVSPVAWWFPPGEHQVELVKKGFKPRKETIRVQLRHSNAFTFEMKLLAREGTLALAGGLPGSRVLVDGKIAGELPFSAAYPPGDYAVEVVFPDGTSWKKVVTVQTEKTVTLEVPPGQKGAEPVKPPEGRTGAGAEEGGSEWWKWTLVGTGAALTVAGAVLVVMAQGKVSDMDSLQNDKYPELSSPATFTEDLQTDYNTEFDSLWSDAEGYYYGGIGCFVVGGAALAAGAATLLFTDGGGDGGGTVSVAPMIVPGTGGFVLDTTF